MLSAGFFQASNETKRAMNKRFKELGYDLSKKKSILFDVLGYTAKLGDMTINEMEQVIDYLSSEDTQNIDLTE